MRRKYDFNQRGDFFDDPIISCRKGYMERIGKGRFALMSNKLSRNHARGQEITSEGKKN